MAENEMGHRHTMEKLMIKYDAREVLVGQVLAFAIASITVVGGVYAAVNGANVAGSLIGLSGVTGLVSAFIIGRNQGPKTPEKQIQPSVDEK
jgi:uncharacterized membrane protein